jgi:hypothetical protein
MKHILFWLLVAINANSCGQATGSDKITTAEKYSRIKVGRSPGSIEAGDLNNDSFIDLIVTSESDSTVTILLGDGKGNFQKESIVFAGPLPNDIAIKDLNHDGDADIVIANHEHKFLTVLLGNGKGSFIAAPGSPFRVEGIPHTHGIATGDFNSDSRVDLVTDSWGNDQVEVLFGNEGTLFKTPGKFFKVGKRPYQRLRTGDINNDGADDIVTTNTEGNNVTVLLSVGMG